MTSDQISASLLQSSQAAGGILRLTLNDPDRRNALSEEMLAALADAFYQAGDNPHVRVIILGAAGPVFCAGHDLKQMTAARQNVDRGRAYFTKILNQCSRVMQTIVTCPKPVIAEVGGVATAAGCQLVASCDLAVAAETAQFCTPGVHIGLFCSTPMVALSRNLANKHTMEMLLTGDMVPASRAAEMGLVNQVVSSSELHAASIALAKKLQQNPALRSRWVNVSFISKKKWIWRRPTTMLQKSWSKICWRVMLKRALRRLSKNVRPIGVMSDLSCLIPIMKIWNATQLIFNR